MKTKKIHFLILTKSFGYTLEDVPMEGLKKIKKNLEESGFGVHIIEKIK